MPLYSSFAWTVTNRVRSSSGYESKRISPRMFIDLTRNLPRRATTMES